MKGIFDAKSGSGYDDDVARRYHFPKQYRRVADTLVGSWIIYREPRRNGGRQAYVAVARVVRIEDDPQQAGHAYAMMDDYLEFDRPVPLLYDGRYAEAALREVAASSRIGAYLQGRSIRKISEEDFGKIVRAGLSSTLAAGNASQIRLDISIDRETEDLLAAPINEQERRIEQILINRKVRDANFRAHICMAYDNRCAVTGLKLLDEAGNAEAQAAHIWSVAEGGPDVVQNGVALSGTAHWLFDRHLIAITDNYELLISRSKVPQKLKSLFQLESNRIYLPTDKRLWPYPKYLAKHRKRFVDD